MTAAFQQHCWGRLFCCPPPRATVNWSLVKGRFRMSSYAITELLSLWAKGELTVEQAVGHLMQNHLALCQRQTEIEHRLRRLEGARPVDPAKPLA